MNLAHMRKRTSIALLVCLVLASALSLLFFFSLTSLLFWAYVIPMPIVLIAGQWNDRRSSLALVSLDNAKRSADGLGTSVWGWTGSLISGLSEALTWPVLLIAATSIMKTAFRQKKSLKAIKTQFAVKIEYVTRAQLYGSIFSFVGTVLLFVPSLVLPTRSAYTLRLMEILALSIGFRHLATFWVPGGLLRIFKRTMGNPLVKFAAYSGFDLLALAVSLTYMTAVTTSARVSFHSLIQTLHKLFSLKAIVGSVPPGGFIQRWAWLRHMPLHQWIATVAGILLYFVIVQLFTNGLGQFERSDDDLVALSVGLSVRNRYDEALRQLEGVKSTNLARSARIFPLIEQGNIDKAAECAKALLSDDVRVQKVINANDVHFLLFIRSTFSSENARVAVWNGAVAANVSPSLLVIAILLLKQNKEVLRMIMETEYVPLTRLARIAAAILGGRKPDTLNDWFPDDEKSTGENVFTEAVLKLRLEVVLQKSREDALTVFDAWSSQERKMKPLAMEALAREGEWGLTLIMELADLLRLTARKCGSTQELWWASVRDKAVKDFSALRGNEGAATVMSEVFTGKVNPHEWLQ